MNILWIFDNESEIFHLSQLVDLINQIQPKSEIILNIPYLPYGRQDKDIHPDSTFALHTFSKIINSLNFKKVITIDAHSSIASSLINNLYDLFPKMEIENAIRLIEETSKSDVILAFPDKGAVDRYSKMFNNTNDIIIGDKERCPATGYITKYKIHGSPSNKSVLIIDDICDGGMTFRIMARDLILRGATEVHLYVSHGIFSKGLEVLKKDGISRIFTKEGEKF